MESFETLHVRGRLLRKLQRGHHPWVMVRIPPIVSVRIAAS